MAHLPRRASRWVIDSAGGDAVAYDPDTDAVHLLSTEAAKVLPLCDGVTAVPDAAVATGLTVEQVELTLHALADLGLLADTTSGLTRRLALQRTAVVGGGVLVATSFGGRLSAMASTYTPPGGGGAGSNGYSAAVLASGPVAYYRLGEAEGADIAQDSSGHGYHRSYDGSRGAPVTGATGDGDAAFDASTGNGVSVGGLLDGVSAFTLEFFVQTTQETADVSGAQWYQGAGLVDAEASGEVADFGVTLFDGHVLFGVGAPDTTIASDLIRDSDWHHVAATWSDGGTMRLYLDGVEVASTAAPSGARDSGGQLFIGHSVSLDGSPEASIDEVALYASELSASTIAAHYAAR